VLLSEQQQERWHQYKTEWVKLKGAILQSSIFCSSLTALMSVCPFIDRYICILIYLYYMYTKLCVCNRTRVSSLRRTHPPLSGDGRCNNIWKSSSTFSRVEGKKRLQAAFVVYLLIVFLPGLGHSTLNKVRKKEKQLRKLPNAHTHDNRTVTMGKALQS
jgi:hypothetical protein